MGHNRESVGLGQTDDQHQWDNQGKDESKHDEPT
ncbi:hypothetical protein J3D43_002064 [Paenibacillus xylanexedens]|nr:hypothetical protein [Paenibacillus xylanexedens]